jgi:hypothetical protein
MSNDETKKRTSARLSVDTLDKIESYQHENNLDNRSAAIEHIVDHHEDVKRSVRWWETVTQQALYAVSFSLLVSVISLVSFAVAIVQAGYPSPWTIISFSFLMGGLLAAGGSGIVHKYSRSRLQRESVGVEA